MKYFFLAFFIGFAIVCGTFFWQSYPQLSLPTSPTVTMMPSASPTPHPLHILGWFASWDEKRSMAALRTSMPSLDVFSPLSYAVSSTGGLLKHTITTEQEMLQLARDRNVPILPTIGDESDAVRIRAVLYDKAVQEKFISALIQEGLAEQYQGWDIDFEAIKGNDEKAFTAFIRRLSERLHEEDMLLYVTVFGRERKETYDPARAHNYEELGKYADMIVLMTYEYNNALTDPGGQAPLSWLHKVLAYATESVPRERIMLGLTTHGYEWGRKKPIALTYPQIMTTFKEHNANIRHDRVISSMVAIYEKDSVKHEIWYENTDTMMEKLHLAQKTYGIDAFAIWRIGAEDITFWEALASEEPHSPR